MSRIIKNVLPYWKSVILIIVFLIIQAFCDLSLPAYTSDIIDVGIQNGGIEHTVPEKITKEEFELAKLFMTEDERDEWEKSYSLDESDGLYILNIRKEKRKDEESLENDQIHNFRRFLYKALAGEVDSTKSITIANLHKNT